MTDSAQFSTMNQQITDLQLQVAAAEPSYRLIKGLKAIGHALATVVVASELPKDKLMGAYDWSPTDTLRLGVLAAAVDNAYDTYADAKACYKGLDVAHLRATMKTQVPEMSDEQINALPKEAQKGYRALQTLKAGGRFFSAAIIFNAAINSDYGMLGSVEDPGFLGTLVDNDILQASVIGAGVQEVGEGLSCANNAIRGL